jgi:capsular polysaccharide biosynthesis protein
LSSPEESSDVVDELDEDFEEVLEEVLEEDVALVLEDEARGRSPPWSSPGSGVRVVRSPPWS